MKSSPNKDIWDYFQAQRTDSMNSSKASVSEANQAERDLNSQLILVSTVIIGVTGAVLAGGIFKDTATIAQAVAALVSLTAAILSIMSGVKYYFVIIKFNQNWAVKHREIGFKYDAISVAAADGHREKYKQLTADVDKFTKEQKETTSQRWLFAELWLLAIAAFGLLALVSAVIFDWSSIVKSLLG